MKIYFAMLDVGLEKALVKDLSGQVLGSRKVFEEMRAEMVANKQDCMVFIHGFNVSFKEALQRCAQLKQFYGGRPMTWLVFTWPSDGSMLPFKAYASDRDDARASGVALGRGLQKLASFLSGTRPEDYCEPVTSRKRDPDGHGYYCLNDTVRQDVLAVLSGQAPVDVKSRRYLPELRTYRMKKA